MSYTPLPFADDSPPDLNAANLNYVQDGIVAAHEAIDLLGVPDVDPTPATVALRAGGGQVLTGTPSAAAHAIPLGFASSTFVRFLDESGNPLPAGSTVTIRVNTTTGDIDDITFEEV